MNFSIENLLILLFILLPLLRRLFGKTKPEKGKSTEKVPQQAQSKKESESNSGFSWDDLLEEIGGDVGAEEHKHVNRHSEQIKTRKTGVASQELAESERGQVQHRDLEKVGSIYHHQSGNIFQHKAKKVAHTPFKSQVSRPSKLPKISSDKHTKLFVETVGEVVKPRSTAFKIDISNRDELKRGVIISEILGKPKALRR